jgi:hypothetical protein
MNRQDAKSAKKNRSEMFRCKIPSPTAKQTTRIHECIPLALLASWRFQISLCFFSVSPWFIFVLVSRIRTV